MQIPTHGTSYTNKVIENNTQGREVQWGWKTTEPFYFIIFSRFPLVGHTVKVLHVKKHSTDMKRRQNTLNAEAYKHCSMHMSACLRHLLKSFLNALTIAEIFPYVKFVVRTIKLFLQERHKHC